MFKKILIANRGEIACRVIRTAQKLGIATVAVYSDADAKAQHVLLADEAIYIGESPAAQSYLQVERIIQAALDTGSEAIHPGYGFLSENDQFALACEQHHLCFIGPPVAAILAMGLKSTSKALMEKAGVPLTPGYHGSNQDADFLKQQADAIGYPLLIKASAGGGGKGMSLVEHSADFLQALASCKREAKSSFGNDDVLIERYVIQPRHIEVQIFGDRHGNYVHLFERDCSVQRRHQKVLEEAPAPQIAEEKLTVMRQAAIDAARAVNYVGAGTVEFIVEQDGTAYFMEMNTRLQVEHPVTEMITGQDLVEWQLRVAYGEPLPKLQHQLQVHGHALEARIYAEQPDQDFLPAIGRIDYLHYPAQNAYVRVDSGIVQGDEITTYYDPMIAKLIVWGENREAALVQMQHALSQFHVEGLGNNISFLRRIISCDAFQQAKLDTNLIQREQHFLFQPQQRHAAHWVTAALIELLCQFQQHRSTQHPLWLAQPFWRLNHVSRHRMVFQDGQREAEIYLSPTAHGFIAEYGKQRFQISGQLLDANRAKVQLDGVQKTVAFHRNATAITLFDAGESYGFHALKANYGQGDNQAAEGHLTAPMPGVVTQVLVSADQAVKKDDVLLTLEAMKMEYTIRAPQDGVIAEAYFQVGDQVMAGDELIAFATAEDVA
ncbi:acetyl/propionyl/methylcrotonyl-CoA carboxylase subunit alpha [Acinetobacter larvae]|uniref:Biotin carboxylase n=1 Tax=Acinetobacter larvae TaxID=1789224 RepID=A0A1B2M3G8_9GAMM|nr:acetyl/propionyl/methylcrotonyl-CoA carboxylase subunit alpha [Acinetobacter larvae]AOA59746.1 3-methylcrotonyl-CoA carboxylase [Acinetobacter larvae]